jgi:hypothetical protein
MIQAESLRCKLMPNDEERQARRLRGCGHQLSRKHSLCVIQQSNLTTALLITENK